MPALGYTCNRYSDNYLHFTKGAESLKHSNVTLCQKADITTIHDSDGQIDSTVFLELPNLCFDCERKAQKE